MPRLTPDRREQDESMWREWTSTCEMKILDLPKGEFVILHIDDAENAFVQIARMSDPEHSDLLVEASIGGWESVPLAAAMLELGWEPPGSYADRGGVSPNYQAIWRSEKPGGSISPADAKEAATLIASTLRIPLAVMDPMEILVERDNF